MIMIDGHVGGFPELQPQFGDAKKYNAWCDQMNGKGHMSPCALPRIKKNSPFPDCHSARISHDTYCRLYKKYGSTCIQTPHPRKKPTLCLPIINPDCQPIHTMAPLPSPGPNVAGPALPPGSLKRFGPGLMRGGLNFGAGLGIGIITGGLTDSAVEFCGLNDENGLMNLGAGIAVDVGIYGGFCYFTGTAATAGGALAGAPMAGAGYLLGQCYQINRNVAKVAAEDPDTIGDSEIIQDGLFVNGFCGYMRALRRFYCGQ
jgi:hypothetical protein